MSDQYDTVPPRWLLAVAESAPTYADCIHPDSADEYRQGEGWEVVEVVPLAAFDAERERSQRLEQAVREAAHILNQVLKVDRGDLYSQADSWLAAHEPFPDGAPAGAGLQQIQTESEGRSPSPERGLS